MGFPPTPGARKGTVLVPRALLLALSGLLLAALLAVASLLGREAGRAETAPPDQLADAAQAPVEPARTGRAGPRPRTEPAPRPRRDDPEPARPSPSTTPRPPVPVPAPAPVAPAEPTIDPRERAAVARYFEEVEATGGDWSQFDALGDGQRAAVRRLRALRVPPACRDYHQQMITLLDAGATLLDEVRRGVQSGGLGALSTLTRTSQRLQTDAEATSRLADDLRRRYGL